MHQRTPAYCHGNEGIVFNVWFEHRHQLPMQLYGFSCHPEEDSQEEVVHECRDHSTEHRNSSWDSADDEGDVQPQQSKAEIQQQLHMDSISEFPEWCMWGVVRWLCSTNILPCVVMHRISSILPNSYIWVHNALHGNYNTYIGSLGNIIICNYIRRCL